MTKDEKYKHQRSSSGSNRNRNHHDSSNTSNGASSSSSFQPNKKKQTVVSLQAFARGKKGAIKALHSYRERKEQKRLNTAKALRSYSQVMKREGYEPGQGASRKRRSINDSSPSEEKEAGEEKHEEHQHQHEAATTALQEGDSSSKGRIVDMEINNHNSNRKQVNEDKNNAHHPRVNSGGRYKQTKMVDYNKNHHRSPPPTPHPSTLQQVDREKERRQKIRTRKQKTAMLRQRTRKGQPIMKNLVHDILEKLQKEKQQQQQESSSSSK